MRRKLLFAGELIPRGLRELLDREIDVVGPVRYGQTLFGAARAMLHTDVIALDMKELLPEFFDVARELHRTVPRARLIFLADAVDAASVTRAFRCGASGYVLRCNAGSELVKAVREVLAGRIFISPGLAIQTLETSSSIRSINKSGGQSRNVSG